MTTYRAERDALATRLQAPGVALDESIAAVRHLIAVIDALPGPVRLTVPPDLYRLLGRWLGALLEDRGDI